MIYCGKAEIVQIPRSFALNSGAIRLKRPKNLNKSAFPRYDRSNRTGSK
jgi:hypothetical protein